MKKIFLLVTLLPAAVHGGVYAGNIDIAARTEGVRGMSMAGAVTALPADAFSAVYNPAALALSAEREISVFSRVDRSDPLLLSAAYVHPYPSGRVLGFHTSDISAAAGGADYNSRTYTAAYALGIGRKLKAGGAFKYVQNISDDLEGDLFDCDAGLIYDPSAGRRCFPSGISGRMRYALKMKDIFGSEVSMSGRDGSGTYRRIEAGRNPDGRLAVGVIYPVNDLIGKLNDCFCISVDRHEGYTSIGCEYICDQKFFLRAGCGPYGSLGIGLAYRAAVLDLGAAFAGSGSLYRMSLNFLLGNPGEEARMMTLEQYADNASGLYRSGAFRRAAVAMNRAYMLSPADRALEKKQHKLLKISHIIPSAREENRRDMDMRRGVSDYMDSGDPELLLLLLNQIISVNPLDREAESLLKMLGEEHSLEDARIEVPEGLNLIDLKLQIALKYFYQGKYNLAIKECAEALKIDPDNFQANKMIGSAYFSINNRDKAYEAWQRAYDINPDDAGLKEFIDNLTGSEKR